MRVIAGKARRLQLKTIPGDQTRPTTDRIKETLFNILRDDLSGARFLDLFAGSGGIGIEALSRDAAYAVFVEQNPKAAACIRDNLRTTRLELFARVLQMDVLRALQLLEKTGEKPFTIVFLDPPYGRDLEKEVLKRLRTSPLIDENTLLIIEADIAESVTWLKEEGYDCCREKLYKTNKHIFARKTEGGSAI